MAFSRIHLGQIQNYQVQRPHLPPKKTTKKCLFGAADPQDTKEMLDAQCKLERERFIERFGIEMEELENIAVDEEKISRKRKSSENLKSNNEKKAKTASRVLRPHNSQTKMTDFCQIKKSPIYHKHQKKI